MKRIKKRDVSCDGCDQLNVIYIKQPQTTSNKIKQPQSFMPLQCPFESLFVDPLTQTHQCILVDGLHEALQCFLEDLAVYI